MRLRVRFAETDQMGIAHHSAYVVWFEAGRVEWLRGLGMSYRRLEEEGVSLAVSGLRVDYRSPAYFDDCLEVETRLSEARSRRVCFEYTVRRSDEGTMLALASTVHTPVDRQGRAMRLPEPWLRPLLDAMPD